MPGIFRPAFRLPPRPVFIPTRTPAAPSNLVNVWSGTAWVQKPVKTWDGTAWVRKPLKAWSGSAWAVTVPTPIIRLDFDNATMDGSGNIVTVPSSGLDTGIWTPNTPLAEFIQNGHRMSTIPGVSSRYNRASYNWPAGDYTFFLPIWFTAIGNGALLGWTQGSVNGDIFVQISSAGNREVNVRHLATTNPSYVITSGSPMGGAPGIGKYWGIGITYDRAANISNIYINGTIYGSGVPTQRAAVPANSGCSFTNCNTTSNGYVGRLLPPSMWNCVLSTSQLQKVQADMAAKYVITWG